MPKGAQFLPIIAPILAYHELCPEFAPDIGQLVSIHLWIGIDLVLKTVYHTGIAEELHCLNQVRLLEHIIASANIIADRLNALRDPEAFPNVVDIRQRGLMVGIELGRDRQTRFAFDFSAQTGAALCTAMRDKGLIVRPLGDVIVLMPIPAMGHDSLRQMLDIVIDTIRQHRHRVQG